MLDNRILTLEQAAELLQLNYSTVRRYVMKGIIPGAKLGKTWRIVESDLKAFITAGGRGRRIPRRRVRDEQPSGRSSETDHYQACI